MCFGLFGDAYIERLVIALDRCLSKKKAKTVVDADMQILNLIAAEKKLPFFDFTQADLQTLVDLLVDDNEHLRKFLNDTNRAYTIASKVAEQRKI
jgi:hypothetical protein